MKTKVDVKFRIRPQRVKNATEGLEVQLPEPCNKIAPVLRIAK